MFLKGVKKVTSSNMNLDFFLWVYVAIVKKVMTQTLVLSCKTVSSLVLIEAKISISLGCNSWRRADKSKLKENRQIFWCSLTKFKCSQLSDKSVFSVKGGIPCWCQTQPQCSRDTFKDACDNSDYFKKKMCSINCLIEVKTQATRFWHCVIHFKNEAAS